jgi:hypothetical protein
MNKISISQAWAYATSFFSDQHPNHAIALIGMGIAVPVVLNLLLGGGAAATAGMMAGDPAAVLAAGSGLFFVGILAFILQLGSYYASWRMGLAPGQETIGSGLGYGLIAALPVLLVFLGFILLFGLIFGLIFGASLVPLLMGGEPNEAMLASMGVGLLIGLPLFFLLMLWFSARLAVMGPVMAHSRSFNPLTAMAESWRMTSASQWKLMGYFVLLFIALMVFLLIVGMFAGVSMLAGGSGAGLVMMMIVNALLGIPLAYLYVGVPAGIYRALGAGAAGEIFS